MLERRHALPLQIKLPCHVTVFRDCPIFVFYFSIYVGNVYTMYQYHLWKKYIAAVVFWEEVKLFFREFGY